MYHFGVLIDKSNTMCFYIPQKNISLTNRYTYNIL